MAEEPAEVSMAWIEGPDGLPILLPAGHLDRVTALCARLIAAQTERDGKDLLMMAKADADLDRKYAARVVQEAVELLARFAIFRANGLDSTIQSRRLPAYIFSARSGLAQGYLPGSQDTRG
jgi:hypothetical protein